MRLASGRYRTADNSRLTKHVVAAGGSVRDAGSTPAASSLRSERSEDCRAVTQCAKTKRRARRRERGGAGEHLGRASLEELLDDYKDYLRARDLPMWDKESKETQYVRRLGRKTPQSYELYREFVDTRPPEVIANIAICLIHQANYLIDQQLRRLEKDFLEQGGLRERMTRARLAYRSKPHPSPPSHDSNKPPRNPGGMP